MRIHALVNQCCALPIVRSEAWWGCQELGENLSDEEVNEMIREADGGSGDGKITHQRFIYVYTSVFLSYIY